jgi:hypothetical protein
MFAGFEGAVDLSEVLPEAPTRLRRILEGGLAGRLTKTAREDVDRNASLAGVPGQHSGQIEILHRKIPQGEAADRHAIAVDEDVSARVSPNGALTVDAVGIVDAHREVKAAPRVEPVDVVGALWHLEITALELRSKIPALSAHRKHSDLHPWIATLLRGGPKLQITLQLEGAKEDLLWRPLSPSILETILKGRGALHPGLLHALLLQLPIEEATRQ